ncbi:MAG: hypothetical protein ACXVA9_04330 [Bdellovibrionales bacterium]
MADVFKAVVNTTPKHTLLTISGTLGEDAELPELSVKLPIRINFKNLMRMNSRGIKKWYIWIHRFKAPAKIYLEDCPTNLINCFNMVKGSLTDLVQIDSFFVPVYSAKTGERKDVLLVRGKDFSPTSVTVPQQKDSKGNIMEIDVHDTYFSFLGQA